MSSSLTLQSAAVSGDKETKQAGERSLVSFSKNCLLSYLIATRQYFFQSLQDAIVSAFAIEKATIDKLYPLVDKLTERPDENVVVSSFYINESVSNESSRYRYVLLNDVVESKRALRSEFIFSIAESFFYVENMLDCCIS